MPNASTSPRVAPAMLERVAAFFEGQHLRQTAPRAAIISAALGFDGYFDADQLHEATRRIESGVSRATVYRMLPPLCAAGLLHASEFGDGHRRYRRLDSAPTPLAEIFVIECGQVLTQPAPFLGWYEQAMGQRPGLTPAGLRLQVFAHCTHRQAGGTCTDCPHHFAHHSHHDNQP